MMMGYPVQTSNHTRKAVSGLSLNIIWIVTEENKFTDIMDFLRSMDHH